MQYLYILFITLFIVGCSTTINEIDHTQHTQEHHSGHNEHANHLGCQEDEVDAEGNCFVAENNNAELFNQDFSNVVQTQRVVDGDLRGLYAYPIAEGDYPGVLMIHEWWGLNENIEEMAQLLASEGYRVFAIDLYDGNIATSSDDALVFASEVRNNPDLAVEKMNLAVDYLEETGARRIATMGWCFGGQQSLLASLNTPVDATVIYYGHLIDDVEQLQNLNGPVLGIFGAEDASISVESVEQFDTNLDGLVEHSIHVYDGVGHAFANPSGNNYAAEETVDAWEKTVAFLDNTLQ